MIVSEELVTTTEVKSWQGLHLLHFQGSTCSQKVRLMLGELGLSWKNHPINLVKHENTTPWFLGINPRGVVPILIHDGVVHVESNDMIAYLDEQFSAPSKSYFFKQDDEKAIEAKALIDLEDSLHNDLRIVTIAFGPLKLKTDRQIDEQEINGAYDKQRDQEVRWWRERVDGTDHVEIKKACSHFHETFTQLNARLANNSWLMGDQISIVDITWFVNIQRLYRAGYPLEQHANLHKYYKRLIARPAFVADAKHLVSRLSRLVFAGYRLRNRLKGNQISNYL